MQIYAVENTGKTIGLFASTLDLLTFLYLHQEEFRFVDHGENLYSKLSGGNVELILNRYLLGSFKVHLWTTGRDTYTNNEEEKGQDVTFIAKKRPSKSWYVTMEDNTKFTIVAPYSPLAVAEAESESILQNGKFSRVEKIEQIS